MATAGRKTVLDEEERESLLPAPPAGERALAAPPGEERASQPPAALSTGETAFPSGTVSVK